jgi:hypothetical protein
VVAEVVLVVNGLLVLGVLTDIALAGVVVAVEVMPYTILVEVLVKVGAMLQEGLVMLGHTITAGQEVLLLLVLVTNHGETLLLAQQEVIVMVLVVLVAGVLLLQVLTTLFKVVLGEAVALGVVLVVEVVTRLTEMQVVVGVLVARLSLVMVTLLGYPQVIDTVQFHRRFYANTKR